MFCSSSTLSIIDLKETSLLFLETSAAPIATKSCGCSGKIISLGVNDNVSINLLRSSDKKNNGPPKNATLPEIVLPQASPPIVWSTTA